MRFFFQKTLLCVAIDSLKMSIIFFYKIAKINNKYWWSYLKVSILELIMHRKSINYFNYVFDTNICNPHNIQVDK